ncbi:hypothetical protein [Micromonospora sp. NBC_01412]|uniref:hypothetical protein n=1 Tax=Micromonospora sp. NBC_01412 TaxID=2903590 RepID=UPI0032474921
MTKLASDRVLTGDDRTLLGCYRQAYRTLSKCLEANLSVGAAVRRQADCRILPAEYEVRNRSNAPTYVTFKELATAVGARGCPVEGARLGVHA